MVASVRVMPLRGRMSGSFSPSLQRECQWQGTILDSIRDHSDGGSLILLEHGHQYDDHEMA